MDICIPVYNDVDMLDVTGPYEMFTWAGLTVDLVAAGPGPIRFRNGFYFFVDKSFSEASPCDVLWVPGGDPDALAAQMSDPSRIYLDFLIGQSAQSKWTASVCEGALLLAAAGLLDGYEATTHWAFAACMTDRFPKVRLVPGHPRFVIDRNRITGGGISSGLDEALKVIEVAEGDAGRAGRPAQYPVLPVSAGQQHHAGHASRLLRAQGDNSAAQGCRVTRVRRNKGAA
jgi:transcriptional regulator GlxA family with amidase domain